MCHSPSEDLATSSPRTSPKCQMNLDLSLSPRECCRARLCVTDVWGRTVFGASCERCPQHASLRHAIPLDRDLVEAPRRKP